jgi:hypothetical protein
MIPRDAIGIWPKHPSRDKPRPRETPSQRRLIRVDDRPRVLGEVARQHGIPAAVLASEYRGKRLNTTERLAQWATRWKARRQP